MGDVVRFPRGTNKSPPRAPAPFGVEPEGGFSAIAFDCAFAVYPCFWIAASNSARAVTVRCAITSKSGAVAAWG